MTRTFFLLPIAFACLVLPAPSKAEENRARPANCLLVVNGFEVIRGQCWFNPIGRDGSFQITGANGKFFAMVLVDGAGVGSGHWNGEPYASHAHNNLGELHREGACWVNDTASVCAY